MSKDWSVEFKPTAFKELKRLDRSVQSQVFKFLDRLIQDYNNPRDVGLTLQGNHKGLWRYRVGDYRLVCEIQDHGMVILVLEIGHRKEIYRAH